MNSKLNVFFYYGFLFNHDITFNWRFSFLFFNYSSIFSKHMWSQNNFSFTTSLKITFSVLKRCKSFSNEHYTFIINLFILRKDRIWLFPSFFHAFCLAIFPVTCKVAILTIFSSRIVISSKNCSTTETQWRKSFMASPPSNGEASQHQVNEFAFRQILQHIPHQ